MPISRLDRPTYRPPKEVVVNWNNWRKGVNNLLRENEIEGSEMVRAQNLLLVGSGVPSKRWGSRNYFLMGESGTGRMVLPVKNATGDISVLSFADWGFLTKKSGSSYTLVAGASWPSGASLYGTQLGGNVYLVSPEREFVRYDFNELIPFKNLSTPTGVAVSKVSGATGTNIMSWRITAVGKTGGETLASTPVTATNLAQELINGWFRVSWTAVSAASGDLSGYAVYRGRQGDEVWVGGTGPSETTFDDFVTPSTDPFRVVPLSNGTQGPKAKFIIRYQDRLILAGIPGEPSKILISGRWPFHERFDWYAGGGFVHIEPDAGENITGLGIHQEKIVVFKENSVWQLNLSNVQFGSYYILDPQYKLLTASQGCKSHKSISAMENDVIFANDQGVYILRYEPQLQNIINANEISAKMRSFFEGLSEEDHRDAAGAYINKKYLLSYPHSKQTIIFDRERLCFYGPWKTPFGINQWAKYIDENGDERWLAVDSTGAYVLEFSANLTSDRGEVIRTIFRSKREDMGDWTLYKTLNEVYTNFRAVRGDVLVSIYVEDRQGRLVTTRAFTITSSGTSGSSGFGANKFGSVKFGDTVGNANPVADEIQRKVFVYKSARTFQVEVKTLGLNDAFELLGITSVATPQARGNSPSSWSVM